MHFLILTIAFSLATIVGAQLGNPVPPCARSCFATATNTTASLCAPADQACICQAPSFLASLQPCTISACDPNSQQVLFTFVHDLCANFGVELPVPGSSSTTTSSSSSSTSASTTSGSTSSTPTSSPSSGITSPTNGTAIATATLIPTVVPFTGVAAFKKCNVVVGATTALLLTVVSFF